MYLSQLAYNEHIEKELYESVNKNKCIAIKLNIHRIPACQKRLANQQKGSQQRIGIKFIALFLKIND